MKFNLKIFGQAKNFLFHIYGKNPMEKDFGGECTFSPRLCFVFSPKVCIQWIFDSRVKKALNTLLY